MGAVDFIRRVFSSGASAIKAMLVSSAGNDIDMGTPLPTTEGKDAIVDAKDTALTWANSAAADTTKTVTTTFTDFQMKRIKLLVKNPSTETDLTVKVYDVVGTDDYLLHTFGVASATNVSEIVNMAGGSGAVDTAGTAFQGKVKVVLSNDTALSASGGFTAELQILDDDT